MFIRTNNFPNLYIFCGIKLKVENLSFAGKTGTTRTEYWKKEESKKYNASFAGYFPADNPKYSVMVVVYNPQGKDYYGGKVAGPVFQGIMKRLSGFENTVTPANREKTEMLYAQSGYKPDFKKLLEYIGIEYSDKDKSSDWVVVESNKDEFGFKSQKITNKVVPDVRGKGLRDAVYLLEAVGLKVEIKGVGKVYKQSIAPRTKFKKNERITILLK